MAVCCRRKAPAREPDGNLVNLFTRLPRTPAGDSAGSKGRNSGCRLDRTGQGHSCQWHPRRPFSHEAVAGFEQTTLSDSDRHKIAHGNAERILRL